MSASLLIVDDEADIRNLVKGILEDEGYEIALAANSDEVYDQFKVSLPELIILDIWLQGSAQDGMEILKHVKEHYPHIPVVMISGHGTIETAVSAIKMGAYDFIEKPFKADRMILMVQRALETAQLRRENEVLKEKVVMNEDLIGQSQPMQSLRQLLKRVAPTNSRILLSGEAGAGKDIVARYIHSHSNRAEQPYMVLSCANLRPERLEIELFGSEANANGQAHIGVLEKAHGGTLLLDEVADMPLETQGKIVRVLQNQSFQRVGGDVPIHVDVRIIASTGKDLEAEIQKENFRQDLYYRLNVVPIHLSPLRDRPQDIAALSEFFLSRMARSDTLPSFSREALSLMQNYDWPGNVRQLKNVIEWIVIMRGCVKKTYLPEDLPPEISGETAYEADQPAKSNGQTNVDDNGKDYDALSLREAREQFEREYLLSQIDRFEGNISKTAEFIGMERSALHRKLKSLDIMPGMKDSGAIDLAEKQKRRA